MKKLFLLLSILIFTLHSTLAQEDKKGFELSFKSGLTLANQYGKDAISETTLQGSLPSDLYSNNPASTKVKPGMNIGGLIEYRFNKIVSLGLGLNYIQKGSRINAITYWDSDIRMDKKVEGNIKWIQNYATIDLPLKIYIPIKQHDINMLAGITAGHLINAKESGNVTIEDKKYKYTNNTGANKNEIGFLLGLGYNHMLPNHKSYLTVDFVWNRSFGNSYGDDLIPTPMRYFNQTFNISVGYKFALRK